jgi:hypothetical protein
MVGITDSPRLARRPLAAGDAAALMQRDLQFANRPPVGACFRNPSLCSVANRSPPGRAVGAGGSGCPQKHTTFAYLHGLRPRTCRRQ